MHPCKAGVEELLVLLSARHVVPVLSPQLRLEALHQIVVLISGMEEKGSQPESADRSSAAFQSSSLLTSVRLQFLAGCFGLGTVGSGGLKRESVQLHHYQVTRRGLLLWGGSRRDLIDVFCVAGWD